MERRLKSGTGDARKIKSAAAALAETLPEAHVLGDVDALAARLTAIVEHADEAAQAERAKRDEFRARSRTRRRWPRAEDATNSTVEGPHAAARNPRGVADHQRAGPQDRRCAVEAVLHGP
jgi:hypothetical protein